MNSNVPMSASRARSLAWIFFVMSFENQLNATRAQTSDRIPLPAKATRSTSRLIDDEKLLTGVDGVDDRTRAPCAVGSTDGPPGIGAAERATSTHAIARLPANGVGRP